jgi:CPA1 family monovalent cation:H+ antiporter
MIGLAVGVVLFTLLAGGPTMAPLIHKLGLDRPTLFERVTRAQAALAAKTAALERVVELGAAEHFSNRLVTDLENRYRGEVQTAEHDLTKLKTDCSEAEMRSVVWSEALSIERRVCREAFDAGIISEPVLRELELSVDLRRDRLKRYGTPGGSRHVRPIEVRIGWHLFRLLEAVAPKSRLVRRRRLRNLASEYEYDTAILEASRRAVKSVRELASVGGVPPQTTTECREWYDQRAEKAIQRIDTVAEHFPEYVQAVQQHTAQRMALDAEADAIGDLAVWGGIPETIVREAKHSVEEEQRRLQRQPVQALEPGPEELLAKVPFFQKVDPEEFQRVVAALVPRTVLAGEVIVHQGEKGTSLFLIARGVVAVIVAEAGRQPRRVASLHAGEFFGEMALLTQEPRSATVQAITGCQLFELKSKDVDGLCEVCPGVRESLVMAFEERRKGGTRPSLAS